MSKSRASWQTHLLAIHIVSKPAKAAYIQYAQCPLHILLFGDSSPKTTVNIPSLALFREVFFFDLGLLTINFLYLYIPKKNSCLGLDPKKLHIPLLGLVL